MNLNEAKTLKENRRVFIKRLIEAGWTRKQAAEEWERIQGECESEL